MAGVNIYKLHIIIAIQFCINSRSNIFVGQKIGIQFMVGKIIFKIHYTTNIDRSFQSVSRYSVLCPWEAFCGRFDISRWGRTQRQCNSYSHTLSSNDDVCVGGISICDNRILLHIVHKPNNNMLSTYEVKNI